MPKLWIATLCLFGCTERLRCVEGQEFRNGSCVVISTDAGLDAAADADVSLDTFINPCSVCSASQQCIANTDAGPDAGAVRCVECTRDTHCNGRVCNTPTNTCVECTGDNDCMQRDAAYPVCDRARNMCRKDAVNGRVCSLCAGERDCATGHRCAEQRLQGDAGRPQRYCFQESSSPCPVGTINSQPVQLPDGTTVGLCLTRDTVSCEAFQNYRLNTRCNGSDASVCGAGGACRNLLCTYTCFGATECVMGTCDTDNTCTR